MAWREFSRKSAGYAICIIEDVTKDWAGQIEDSVEMDPHFFQNHFSRYRDTGPKSWNRAVELEHEPDFLESEQQWRSIEGSYSLCGQPRTRMSYYRLEERLCKV